MRYSKIHTPIPPSKSLFNDYLAKNEVGKEISKRTCKFAIKLFNEFLEEGYSPREISHIICAEIHGLETEFVLQYSMKKKSEIKSGY